MKFKIVNDLTVFLDNIIPEKHLSKLQEFLLSGAIFTDASKVLAQLIIFILASEIVLALAMTILKPAIIRIGSAAFCSSGAFHICCLPAGKKSTGNRKDCTRLFKAAFKHASDRTEFRKCNGGHVPVRRRTSI